jgi:hypothetical protein
MRKRAARAAGHLNSQLRSRYFKAGRDLGSFAVGYDTATTI